MGLSGLGICPTCIGLSLLSFEVELAGNGKVVAGPVGKIGNGPGGGHGMEAAAGDEVEAEWENAALFQDAVADGAGDGETIFESREIDGTRGGGIVERFPRKAGAAKFARPACGHWPVDPHCDIVRPRHSCRSPLIPPSAACGRNQGEDYVGRALSAFSCQSA